MSAIRLLKDTLEGNPDYIRLRVENPGGTVATAVSLTSISYRVIEYANEDDGTEDSNGTELLAATNLTPVATYVFALASWSLDSTGYNFELLSPGTNRPNGGKWIRHQITFTPVTGPAYTVVTLNKVLALND